MARQDVQHGAAARVVNARLSILRRDRKDVAVAVGSIRERAAGGYGTLLPGGDPAAVGGYSAPAAGEILPIVRKGDRPDRSAVLGKFADQFLRRQIPQQDVAAEVGARELLAVRRNRRGED